MSKIGSYVLHRLETGESIEQITGMPSPTF